MNKMDRIGADFYASVQIDDGSIGRQCLFPFRLPDRSRIGDFKGSIDLVTMKAIRV